jgi:hypothetical protein
MNQHLHLISFLVSRRFESNESSQSNHVCVTRVTEVSQAKMSGMGIIERIPTPMTMTAINLLPLYPVVSGR